MTVIAVVVLFVGLAAAGKMRYDNYQVVDIIPETLHQVQVVKAFQQAMPKYDFWTERIVVDSPVVLMIPPEETGFLNNFITHNDLRASVRIPNVQKLIDREAAKMLASSNEEFGWDNYHSLDKINAWMYSLETNESSGAQVQVVTCGVSYEGRDIKGLRINHGPNLPGVILESGIHAREWIAPAATSWIVNQIIISPENSLWRNFNYLYIPIFNPDGYHYTHTIGGERLWRKSRKPYLVGNQKCYGVDLNRNWDHYWFGGANSHPCSNGFSGPKAFSEVETKSVSEYFKSVSTEFDIYLTFHSFGQLLMFPWACIAEHSPHHDLWQLIADKAVSDLKDVHGVQFSTGSIYDTFGGAIGGSSLDWYYAKFNSTLSFAFELRDRYVHGFLLPADQIIPSAEELKAAVARILTEYLKL